MKHTNENSNLGAPRTIQFIVHAKVFDLIEGWNEIDFVESSLFSFSEHAFNFDYLVHLSGINYLIHPDDAEQVIALMKSHDQHTTSYRIRFINRSGEMRIMHGTGRLTPSSLLQATNIV